jgi:DNA helicase-2/ATP-dependent DNA helicase PcrA
LSLIRSPTFPLTPDAAPAATTDAAPAATTVARPDTTLNTPQAEAVAHAAGPILVFAGAGSGKTRVITYRIANLVACEHVPPYRILAVTFTNKAAGEMRSRLAKIVGESVARDLWVGTFHATCAKLLRRYADAVGLSSSFVIYDSQDQKTVITRVLKELELDEKRYAPRAVLARIHKEKQEARGPDDMSMDSYFDGAIQKAYVRYEERLRAANAVDFEDLILHVVRILEAPKNAPDNMQYARDAMRGKFDHVLVDEFQDTNATQYRFIRALAARTRNLCVVGDDDQSIYRWRGADVRNIRGFRDDYPDAQIVKLEQNYRSTGRIVRAALAVISPSREREPKELWTDNDEGGKIHVLAVADERDEAAEVARLVKDARGEGIPAHEIAVFYRVNAQSRVLEEALRYASQPYQIVGGMKFYERAEIKDALAYLRVIVNPKSDVDFLRIVNTPPRGIGKTTLDRLQEIATAQRVPLWNALDFLDSTEDVPKAARKKLGQVRELLRGLADETKTEAPSDALRIILAKTGYRAALAAENTVESESRLENLAELESSLLDYAQEAHASGETPTMEGFLERVSLDSDLDSMEEDNRITLMTVHSAKGLEFDFVVITGMEEDMFPYRSQDGPDAAQMEEERRLGYVAITRARKHLVLSHARMRQIFGITRPGIPSRFISDLPDDLVDFHATAQLRSRDTTRYIDRTPRTPQYSPGGFRHPQSIARPSDRPPPVSNRIPGERYIDREESHDQHDEGHQDHHSGEPVEIRRGTRVRHARFGEGEVRKVLELSEPAVLAFFPGWGEMKVLARFLTLA